MNLDLLDPKAREMLEELQASERPNSSEVPIEEARANLERLMEEVGPGPDVAEVSDRTIGASDELRARLYRGVAAGPADPLIVYLHGGGHAQGSIATSDALCRGLANACRATVLNVDYRLAPEHAFPAAYDDAVAASAWALANAESLGADPDAVVLAGDSAGGNLAFAVTATSEEAGALAAQLLIYPLSSMDRKAELYDRDFDDFFVTFEEMENFASLYVPEGLDLADPRLSPLDAVSLAEVPPTVIVAAQCDPIHLQAEATHARLLKEGVSSELHVYPGMIHGFYGMTSLFGAAQQAFDDTAASLNSILSARQRAQS